MRPAPIAAAILLPAWIALQAVETAPAETIKGADLELLRAVREVASRVEVIRTERFGSAPIAVRAGRDARRPAEDAGPDLAARGRAWEDIGLGGSESPRLLARLIAADLDSIALDRQRRRLLVAPEMLSEEDFFPKEEGDETVALLSATGVRPDEPAVAHMLVHLLQARRTTALPGGDTTDGLLARTALAEGEANLVAMRYLFSAMGLQDEVLDFGLGPDAVLGGALLPSELAAAAGVERSLLDFVYLDGFDRLARIYRSGGWDDVDALLHRCRTTRDLLHPEREPAAPFDPGSTSLENLEGQGYALRDADSLGEQGIVVLISTLTGKDNLALQAGDGWRGDLLQRWEKAGDTAGGVTAWLTVWDGPEAAADFAYAFRRGQNERYGESAEAATGGVRWEVAGGARTLGMKVQGDGVMVLAGPTAVIVSPSEDRSESLR